jgi:ribosomal protein L37E
MQIPETYCRVNCECGSNHWISYNDDEIDQLVLVCKVCGFTQKTKIRVKNWDVM